MLLTARSPPEMGVIIMPNDNEQKEGLLLSIWQAITLVGDVRERSDEIEPSELEFVLAEAESLLIDAVSEAAQGPGRPARPRRLLRFWKAARDTPSRHVSWSPSTRVIPFPGTMISKAASCFEFDRSTALRTGKNPDKDRPAYVRYLNPGGAEAETRRPRSPGRSAPVGGTFRLFLLVALALVPMIAIQAWHERDLRDERGGIIRERVIYRTQQLAAEIGGLREGARQLLLAIGQLEAVKLRQPEACSTLLAKGRTVGGDGCGSNHEAKMGQKSLVGRSARGTALRKRSERCEWALIEDMPAAKRLGDRARRAARVLDAILISHEPAVSGACCKGLSAVYHRARLFLRLARRRLFEKINFALLLQAAKRRAANQPSAGVIDSQSVKTPRAAGREVTMPQKVKGRKRHIVTDTCGLLVGAEVHPADVKIAMVPCWSLRPSTSCFPGYAISSPTVSTTVQPG